MTSLDADTLKTLQQGLTAAQEEFVARFPGDSGARQPVSVIYGGAHLYKAESAQKLGQLARQALATYAPDPSALGEALGLSREVAERVHPRVVAKLEREAVEDQRIDFEDGYGHRSDEEEDAHALAAAREVARGLREGLMPPFWGVRVKPMSAELGLRGIRTLDLFLTELKQPALVTLPKVVSVGQVRIFVAALSQLERKLGFPPRSLRMEFMVEAAQGLVDHHGRALLPQLHAAADGRLQAAHFGTYDYTASLDITAAQQAMRHPACDVAKAQMKLAFAGTGVFLSDGATTRMPIPPHRPRKSGEEGKRATPGLSEPVIKAPGGDDVGGNTDGLTEAQQAENRRVVHAAWRASADDIRHSLAGGFYQGWDLHPAQLVARYGTVYAFFLESLDAATDRLSNFVKKLGQATATGDVFDDAATGQGLLNFFLRGLSCGALTDAEVAATGLTPDELQSRSFAVIARNRRRS